MRPVRTLGCLALALAGCADTKSPTGDAAAPPPDTRFVAPDGLPRPDTTCVTYSTEAQKQPAAMMIVLDRSSSMSTNKKWDAAVQAIIKAIDSDAFDNMQLGLLAYPAYQVPAPECIWLALQVSCGVPPLPQVPLADSGTQKSSAGGPRKEIYKWLLEHGPDNTMTDASPGYEALASALAALQKVPVTSRRFLLFITDGGFSCTSVSSPTRPGYLDGNGCADWEHPATVLQLLQTAASGSDPISTFIVGVPGSDSTGQKQGPYDTAPYHMRLALSAYAAAGSPWTVDPTCDGRTFTKDGADPKNPCHYDMTSSSTFDATALATVIDGVRGKALGCSYQLPKVDDKNQVILPNKVNVRLTIDGGPVQTIPKRTDPKDGCLTGACWDFNAAGDGIELIGQGCALVKGAKTAKVEIIAGCMTVLK